MLTLLTNRAKSITDCYAPAGSFLSDAGPIVAAEVAAASASTAAMAATSDGVVAQSSGDSPSSVVAPVVLPLNQIALGTPGGTSVLAVSSCSPHISRRTLPQPRMMMPQPAPAAVNVQPAPADTLSSYPSQVLAGLSGIAPPWGGYYRRSANHGLSIDWLATICSHPLAAVLLSAAVGWGLTQITKGRR